MDTGSPFLTIAGSCTERWGCYNPSLHGQATLYSDTIEVYAAKEGPVSWRSGRISFLNASTEDGREWGATEYAAWQSEARNARMQGTGGRGGVRVRGQVGATPLVFGVLSDGLVGRPGGVFVGLIKERDKDIRPTFLGQTDFVGFSIDLGAEKTLRLSRVPLLSKRARDELIQLTDLRVYGDPVQHYAALAHLVFFCH